MKFPIKVVWVAGGISAKTEGGVAANVEKGRQLGMEVWRAGAAALVPHTNSIGMVKEGAMSCADVYLGDLEMLRRCDAMIRVPGWEGSQGVEYETAWAVHLGLPVFDSIKDLKRWLDTGIWHAPLKIAAKPGGVLHVEDPAGASAHELRGK